MVEDRPLASSPLTRIHAEERTHARAHTVNTHTHTHTHARTHACTHIHTQACARTHIHTPTHMHAHRHTHTHYRDTHTHTQSQSHTYTHTHTGECPATEEGEEHEEATASVWWGTAWPRIHTTASSESRRDDRCVRFWRSTIRAAGALFMHALHSPLLSPRIYATTSSRPRPTARLAKFEESVTDEHLHGVEDPLANWIK